ncbi:hypothetical protein IJZ97_00790, partial [bacterium]|nr:hypothetical protein [bacterium]
MIVNSINLITYTPQTRKQPNFEGQPLNLNQVLKTRSKLLPARVLEEVKKVTTSKGGSTLTLKDIHSKVYAPLLECKNLDDAQKLFPEFSEVKEANTSFKRVTGNIKKLKENGYLKEGLS